MEKYIDKKISEYLDQLSARAPVPGGGSAAALVGALGGSLLCMVTHFTLGGKAPHSSAELKKILLASYRIRDRFSRLVDEDAKSYLEYSRASRAARRMSQGRSREKVLRQALRKALASSLNICKLSHRGLFLSRRLISIGNEALKSDAVASGLFFYAAFSSAALMSDGNVRSLKVPEVAKRTGKILSSLRKEMGSWIRELRVES